MVPYHVTHHERLSAHPPSRGPHLMPGGTDERSLVGRDDQEPVGSLVQHTEDTPRTGLTCLCVEGGDRIADSYLLDRFPVDHRAGRETFVDDDQAEGVMP